MTLEEARACIGRAVLYQPYPGQPTEHGVITSVNAEYVFVRYRDEVGGKATRADHLHLLPQGFI